MSVNLLVGLFAVAVGLATLGARLFGWDRLISKKAVMIARFGPVAGNLLHFISYTVAPLIIGATLLLAEF